MIEAEVVIAQEVDLRTDAKQAEVDLKIDANLAEADQTTANQDQDLDQEAAEETIQDQEALLEMEKVLRKKLIHPKRMAITIQKTKLPRRMLKKITDD